MAKKTKIDELIGRQESRHVQGVGTAVRVIDAEARTVEVAFSSEYPVARWFGNEVLDHSDGSCNLDRLNNGAPLLDSHWNYQVSNILGVVESARIDTDKIGRAVVRFSKREDADLVFQDVKDGIIRNVSVGYMLHAAVLDATDDTGDTYRITDWEPCEISLCPVPADPTVGVGRAQTDPAGPPAAKPISGESNRPNPKRSSTMAVRKGALPTGQGEDDPEEVETTTPQRSEAIIRAEEIRQMGEIVNEPELAIDFVADGRSLADFRAAVQAKRKKAQEKTTPAPQDDPTERQSPRIEFVSSFTPRHITGTVDGRKASERAYRAGQFIKATMRNNEKAKRWCAENGLSIRAAHKENEDDIGGFLVPIEIDNDILVLRERYGVFRRNCRVTPMSSNQKDRRRRKGGLTAYAVGEGQTGTESQKNWDSYSLNARKWMVLAKVTSDLDEDATIALGDDFADEIAYAFSQAEDDAGFNGDGTSTYHRIKGLCPGLKGLSGTIANIAGLVVGSGNAYSELLKTDFTAMIGLLPEYAETPNVKWFCHKFFWANVMVPITLAAGGVTRVETEEGGRKMFLGYPVEVSQKLPKTEANSQVCALLGDLSLSSDLGDRRATRIAMSEESSFSADDIDIKGTTRFDINNHDIGNASGTAALRVPGPVIGLITAAS